MNNENLEKLLSKQKNCLEDLEDSLSIDFKLVWNKRMIDDEYFKYYVETCLKMLENKDLSKDPQIKQSIFTILEFVMKEHSNSLKNIQIKLINLIYEEEKIVEPIADFIIKAYKSDKTNMTKLATTTLTMLVNFAMEKTNVNNESQAIKNTKEFLSKASENIPKLFYINLSAFIPLYDSEVTFPLFTNFSNFYEKSLKNEFM